MLRDECDRASVDEFKPRDAKGSARHRTLGRDIASIRWSPLAADNASCSAASSASLSWPADVEADHGLVYWLGRCHPQPNPAACCARCARTLGCVAWTHGRGGECCLRQVRPTRWWPAGPQHTAGVLTSAPCERGCLMYPHPRPNDDASQTVSADEFPWVRVQQRAPPLKAAAAGAAAPRVAVCLAGAARSFVNPFVWGSIRDHVLRAEPSSPLDLFLVLGTGPEANPRIGLHPAPHPRLLEAALDALQPKRVRFQLWPQRFPCGKSSAGQFAKWAHCVEEVEAHEAEAAGGGRRGERPPQLYDFIFKGRPDVAWLRPLPLHALALMLAPTTLLTSNDVNVLGDREAWRRLVGELLPSRMRCPRRCEGERGGVPFLRRTFSAANEYCLLISAIAAAGVGHVEASHPPEPWLLVQKATDMYACCHGTYRASPLAQFDATTWRIARLDERGGGFWAARVGFSKDGNEWELKDGNGLADELPTKLADAASGAGFRWYYGAGLLGGALCRAVGDGPSRRFSCAACTAASRLRSGDAAARTYAEVVGPKAAAHADVAVALDSWRANTSLADCPRVWHTGGGGGGEGACWRGAGEGCWPTAAQLRAQQAERAAAFGALGFSRPRHAEEACVGVSSAACTGGLTRLHRLSEFLRMGDACGKFPPSWPVAKDLGVS